MAPSNNDAFWQFAPEYWFKKLKTSAEGLSQKEAQLRLGLAGHTSVTKPKIVLDLLLFLNQFKSPLMLLLLGAVLLSALLGDKSDVYIILFIVISTGLLSFFQERKAGRILSHLRSLIALKNNLCRNGVTVSTTAELIPGDILFFKAGDMIPADCLILSSNMLYTNEASLTGESYPISKHEGILGMETKLAARNNSLWEGSSVVSGTAKALVINTGKATLFGTIMKGASQTIETSFEKGIKDFGYFLMKITLVLSIFILIINLINHKNAIESGLFALALAVGMAPELLPAITTIAMSAGARRMLEKKVIVKKLSAIQNLGEVNLLCTDKTGTLTEGSIAVNGIVNYMGLEDDYTKKLAYWNAFYESGYSNPIDEALKKINITQLPVSKKIGEIPYDFIRKKLSIAITYDENSLLICKGAFTEISLICTQVRLADASTATYSDYQESIQNLYESYGKAGLRVIALCYKTITTDKIHREDETNMIFAGFLLLQDPVKVNMSLTIEELKKLKVNLKIITGDNQNIAVSVGSQIGLINLNVITGKQLFSMSDEALHALAKTTDIFAEIEPQQKGRIIHTLRKSYTVAYMGDGINDVSAMTIADIGISVANAVDVAKDAADFVLLEKDLNVLIDGIKEGRKTFANTLKYIYINTGSTFGNMCSVSLASLLLPFLPMLPKQILLTNFITDFPYLSVTGDNVDQQQLNKPGKWKLKVIRNYMVVFGLHSSLFDLLTFLTLFYILQVREATFQTAWFMESVLSELFILFIVRTRKNFYKSRPGKYLFFLSITGFIITLALPYVPLVAIPVGLIPLSFLQITTMLSIVTLYILTADLLKVWFFNRYKNSV